MKRFISTLIAILLIFSSLSLTVLAADRPFIDIISQSWYEESTMYCYEHGYMCGTSLGQFEPQSKLTRAMAVQIIRSMCGDDTDYSLNATFKDVTPDKWYHDAVEWSYANDIVKGTGNGRFSPNSNVTRQDFYVILYNYSSVFSHYEAKEINESYLWYDDNDSIADYAIEAMNWAAGQGLLSGYDDNTVRPGANMTRAEITSIILRYDKILGHRWKLKGTATQRTCTNDGHALYICEDCPSYINVTYEKGHIRYLDKTTIGTCIISGFAYYKCINCDVIKSESTGYGDHSYTLTSVVKPTRTIGGYSTYSCIHCKATKNVDHTAALGRTEGWDSDYNGKLTIDEYLGAYGIVPFLTQHKSDYVGTPYISLSKHINEPWKLLRDKGQYPSNPGMNCTGFVASVLQRCGGNLGKVYKRGAGSYANAYNWQLTINNNNIYHYTFYSIDAALNSGLLKKGDIFLFLPTAKDNDPNDGLDPDYHFGIFWGDTPYHNVFWHSTGATKYNRGAGVTGLKNQITRIGSGTPYSCIYVLPLSDSN